MFKKMKENKKKGFTLVELIVVLVILAILAALLIPALTGYIDKAKNKSIIAETRQAVMAAQTLADEKYANDRATTITLNMKDIQDLAETKQEPTSVKLDEGKVVELVYTNGGKTCVYSTKGDVTGKGDDTVQGGNYYVDKSGVISGKTN